MRTHLFRAAVVATLSLAAAVPAFAQAGMLKGRVMDAQGQPVADAKVELIDTDGRRTETKSDKKGEFVQVGLRSGSYKVTASKDKVGSQTLNANVRQGGQGTSVDFRLSPTSAMSGADVKKLAALQAAYTAGQQAQRSGDHDAAIAKFQEAIAASPECKECYSALGYSYTDKKQYAEAETSFNKAIAIDGNYADAYSGLAALYNAQKKYDLAQQAGAKAASLAPAAGAGGGGGEAAYNQGVILFNSQKYAEAKTQFEAAVKANPNMAIAQYQLGMTSLNLGQIPDAVKALEAYLQLEPNGDKAAEVKTALPALKSMVK
jgi:tetratricopeptide (TPR) repeat protein